MLGSKRTPEQRAVISEARLGNKNALGFKHTAQARAKMSETRTGRKMPPFTDEHRANLAAAHKGAVHTQEHKDKNAAAQRGNTHALGLKRTPEQKQAQSMRQTGKARPYLLGKKHTSEQNAAKSLRQLGRKLVPRSAEHKANISAGKTGKPWSLARRAAHEQRYGAK